MSIAPQKSGDALLSADQNRRMFDRIARRYDLMNALLSLGMHRAWRRRSVAALAPQAGRSYLDIGCGTGDIAIEILRQAPAARVIGIDAAERMLEIARTKAARVGLGDAVSFQAGDASRLPFDDGAFAGAISAFCIRNVTDRAAALAQMRRVLAPQGIAVILELTVPPSAFVRAGHQAYSRCVAPAAGAVIARSRSAYQYLIDSIRNFPKPEDLLEQMRAAGFADTQYTPLSLGSVTIFTGKVV